MKLHNYALGKWITGDGAGQSLHDASTGDIIAVAATEGLDFEAMFRFARLKGNAGLRKMTFHERGRMLRALAGHLSAKKESFYMAGYATGATYADSLMDIDAGIANLVAAANLARQLPDETYMTGGTVETGSHENITAHSILVPGEGVAIHINAFCFPVYNMLEKLSANWLAGIPAIIKPATLTSFLAEKVVKEIIASGILPEGALQLVCGPAAGMLDFVTGGDVVTFTGSAETGNKLRSHPAMLSAAVPFYRSTAALNACILGPDAAPGTKEFDIFITAVYQEMTIKSGQNCTAARRAIVPEKYLEDACSALTKILAGVVIGDPRTTGVQMGPLAGCCQLREVKKQIDLLSRSTPVISGDPDYLCLRSGDAGKGAFLSPVLMVSHSPLTDMASHEMEVLGPVCTFMPYQHFGEAIAIAGKGKGALCSTIVTRDDKTVKQYVLDAGARQDRILILNGSICTANAGSMIPLLAHNRSCGGGAGGKNAVSRYMQQVIVQGAPDTITAITSLYQPGSKQVEAEIHVFRKHFEELEIGETVFTNKRTVTEADISCFSNLSWDHFYAHTDVTAIEGSMFRGIVAHGYLILAMAAGLFVDAAKGPVLLNYGLEECRFTKPVYPGSTIGVRLTVKEKIKQEKKKATDRSKGIVKFLVDVYDETGETVAIATILTLVRGLN